ncbi:MAG: T9SS type A sorting domain-containing protein [Saprospiraceae bacterium]
MSAHVALDYPQGGETFIEGQTVTIQWHIVAFHVTLNWDLYFSADGGDNWQPIQLDIPLDSLSYTWYVPAIFTSQGRVRIIQDNATQDYLDFSLDFTILPNTSPPSLDGPASNIIIQCGMNNPEATLQSWLDNHGGAIVSNHCGQLTWAHDFEDLSNDCGGTGNAIVTFTATDECGSTYSVASVYFIDSAPPNMDVLPSSIVVECDGHGNAPDLNAWLANHGGAQASDACGNVVWTNNLSPILQQCGSSGSSIISFIVTDECGNSAVSSASFTIIDQTEPEVTNMAQSLNIECGPSNDQVIQQWLNNHGGAEAHDLCGTVNWNHNYSTLSYSCGTAGHALVVFTAMDDCGNTSVSAAMLSIEDHLAPDINQSAQDTTIVCDSFNQEGIIQSWIDKHGGAEASDLCGMVNWTNEYAELNVGCGITSSAKVVFTATDECGNGATTSAIISLIDQIPPVVDIEAMDTAIACGLSDQQMIFQQWLDQHGGASAHDDCGDIFWQYDAPVVDMSCDTTFSYGVTFTVVDECGNSNETTALFTILRGTTSNKPIVSEPGFNLYPNPVHDVLTLDFDRNDFKTIRLSFFDTYCNLLWSVADSKTVMSIPMSQYPTGVYFLRIEMENRTFARFVLKQ